MRISPCRSQRRYIASVGLLAVSLISGPSARAQNVSAAGVEVVGVVVDETTELPVPSATVTVLDSLSKDVHMLTAMESGVFTVSLAPGVYAFRVRRIGYREVTTPRFEIRAGSPRVEVTLMVPAERVQLEAVTVTAEAPAFRPGPLADFEARRLRRMGGLFLTPEDLEARSPTRIHEIFYALAGVRVIQYRPGRYTVRLGGQGNAPFGTAGEARKGVGAEPSPPCPPVLYVDGIRVVDTDGTLNALPASEIDAVEVYRRASESPAEFLDSDSRCGVIVLWTRRGPGDRGRH